MDGNEILELVRWQVSLGPRHPGSPAHTALRKLLYSALQQQADRFLRQEFSLDLQGRRVSCANLIGIFEAQSRSRPGSGPLPLGASNASRLEPDPQPLGTGPLLIGTSNACRGEPDPLRPGSGPLLIGTHFDTRLRADREVDPGKRDRPIPGANDGGSGTAVLYYLLKFLRETPLKRDVWVVFFDAEDVGDIDDYPFSVGARILARQPPSSLGSPQEVIILDMVGGKDLCLDWDLQILNDPASFRLSSAVFQIGSRAGFLPFSEPRQGKMKHIICDHYPFLRRGIPSCLLIDLDYPQWHTQQDLPEAMSADSLAMIAEVLKRFLLPFPVKDARGSAAASGP